jgi:dephospho-CoA kinase
VKVIGITGRIGSGKSTLCGILADRYGCAVIDADRIGHAALAEDPQIRRAVIKRFGRQLLDRRGRIRRSHLARVVFADASALEDLNRILHPWIIEVTLKRVAALRAAGGAGIVLLDAALLLDWKDQLACDRVVLVRCPDERLIERLRLRGMSQEQARQRLDLQAAEPRLLEQVDLVVDNSGSRADLEREAVRLWETLRRAEEERSP